MKTTTYDLQGVLPFSHSTNRLPFGSSPYIFNPSSANTRVSGLTLPGRYAFNLFVTDSDGKTDDDTMYVTVTDSKCLKANYL